MLPCEYLLCYIFIPANLEVRIAQDYKEAHAVIIIDREDSLTAWSEKGIERPDLPPVLFLILHNFIYEPLYPLFYILSVLSSICLRLFYAFLIFALKRRGNALTTLKKGQQRQSWKKSWVQLSSTRTQTSLKRAWQTLLLLTMAMEMAFTFHQCPGSEKCQPCQQCVNMTF